MLKNKNVTLYVTGSIAVYKSLELTRLLVKQHNNVTVVMTKSATEFVTPLTFMTVSKNHVYVDEFETPNADRVNHIFLADQTDVAIVAPATANTIAKMANGIADNIVTSALLATTSPVFVVPTMNSHMLANPATDANLAKLASFGIAVMPPATGFLAEGYEGKGRMPEPTAILDWVQERLQPTPQSLAGKKIIVTAGGTRERIDPVRYLTNDSSGKMGVAVATAAQQAGAEVTLIAGSMKVTPPTGINVISVTSTNDMYEAVNEQFASADGLVMAAAVSDFRPATSADHKIKKDKDHPGMTLELVENPDIVATMGAKKRADQFLVGFAAETNDLKQNAQKKLTAKHLDLMVANDVSQSQIGFNSDDNQVTFMWPDGRQQQTPIESKAKVAEEIVDIIATDILKEK
ncbi:pantothenate metabolism flavoprotein Dfp [Lentilactobacillus senioris DSM 24302 = JCM 17472]|uniref:Coenzyme A biosynthesis bifunctional protein CoaBC n=1 Tax=Lentilactobacillus senioris DSM 24302 = JCM 17472 TaxID=1423802 RepID=A0A0R2CW23_9LACO|nr:bifunctional phosphopantothenoylcysteine decarboxylase/phosphopantothenate--cysteine ligase CoaBC [Lentilactobacillus senioris]KRM93892.1 pantothenate metabolism flavoprotein Dfp [Lentilactobacillus senioris DSM 24302 = JCM 17472]